MADMEKVIKGLEMCTKPTPSYCRQCPYRGIPDDYPHCVHDRLQQDALALLKKQEAQKLFVDESGNITPLPVVVRCKDCKYWDADEHDCNIKIGWFACGADWFCADGERNELK